MRVRWDQLDGWLRWEGEWDMSRLRVPRPVLVCFDDDVASLIAYGPDLTSRTLPEIVQRFVGAVRAIEPVRFVVAWPAIDTADGMITEERGLRFALVTTAADRTASPPQWTHRRLVCEWRGRTVRWRTTRTVRPNEEPYLSWLRRVEERPHETAADVDRGLRAALDEDGFDVFVDPEGPVAPLLSEGLEVPADEPWLHVGRRRSRTGETVRTAEAASS